MDAHKAATGGRGMWFKPIEVAADSFRRADSATSGRGFMRVVSLCVWYHPRMPRTLGYHIVISGYGLWLPGDERGHWSEAWDAEVGFVDPHTLHAGDPVRMRMAEERQKHPPVRLDSAMQSIVIDTIARCRAESDWRIAAASIEATHVHLLVTYTERDVDTTVKWLKDQATKAIHRQTPHAGPVWCKGRWRSFIFDPAVWRNSRAYIERHNERRGVGPRPYAFVDNVVDP